MGDSLFAFTAADGDDHTCRAGHRLVVEIDHEAALREQVTPVTGWLGLAARVEAILVEVLQELAAAVSCVAIDLWFFSIHLVCFPLGIRIGGCLSRRRFRLLRLSRSGLQRGLEQRWRRPHFLH